MDELKRIGEGWQQTDMINVHFINVCNFQRIKLLLSKSKLEPIVTIYR